MKHALPSAELDSAARALRMQTGNVREALGTLVHRLCGTGDDRPRAKQSVGEAVTVIPLGLLLHTLRDLPATPVLDSLFNTVMMPTLLSAFVCDPGVSCLGPAPTSLWQPNLLVCQLGEISDPPQFLPVTPILQKSPFHRKTAGYIAEIH